MGGGSMTQWPKRGHALGPLLAERAAAHDNTCACASAGATFIRTAARLAV